MKTMKHIKIMSNVQFIMKGCLWITYKTNMFPVTFKKVNKRPDRYHLKVFSVNSQSMYEVSVSPDNLQFYEKDNSLIIKEKKEIFYNGK